MLLHQAISHTGNIKLIADLAALALVISDNYDGSCLLPSTGEKRKLIKPTSSNNPKLEELKLVPLFLLHCLTLTLSCAKTKKESDSLTSFSPVNCPAL